MARRPKQLSAKHQGKLHWGSLLKVLPQNLAGRAQIASDDPFGLGWTLAPPAKSLHLTFSGMLYATAEAIAALAVFSDQIRAVSSCDLTLTFSDGPQDWVNSLGLRQIENNAWQESTPRWTRPFGCYAYPITKSTLTNKSHLMACALDIVQAVRLLPDDILGLHRTQILASVERVAYEALLNIYEHAYAENLAKDCFYCVTVTPARHFGIDTLEQELSTPIEERRWHIENRDALILEIAIADAGKGIPHTLWKNARERKIPFANVWGESEWDVRMRTDAHQSLCDYAFHYASSRKCESDFSSANRLNWRGLHRCLKQTELLSGSIALASGRGRAGYVFIGGRMQPIRLTNEPHSDFPGTLVVLRFSASQRRRNTYAAQGNATVAPLSIGARFSEEDLRSHIPVERTTRELLGGKEVVPGPSGPSGIAASRNETFGIGTKVIAAYFPFSEFSSGQSLLAILPALPPNAVTVLLFARIPREVRAELRAHAGEDWSHVTHGIPRLFCIWEPGTSTLAWQIAGELPSPRSGQKLYSDLETLGHATLDGESIETTELAQELAATYRESLAWDPHRKVLRFSTPAPVISPEDYGNILNEAFSCFLKRKSPRPFITVCGQDEAIRLPTGRLVKQFLSVLDMLRGNPVLVDALSQRLFDILDSLGTTSDLCLVAEGPASYFVATILLRGRPEVPRVQILQPAAFDNRTLGSRPVLFVDAMCRGKSIERLLSNLPNISTTTPVVIACVDMRRAPSFKLLGTTCSVYALVTHYFNPGECPPSDVPDHIIEVDSITHVPLRQVCEFAKLTHSEVIQKFLNDHPQIFTSGYHRIHGGQIHTVSLRTDMLVQEYQPFLVTHIVTCVTELLADLPARIKCRNLVLFCRPESKIYPIARNIADELLRQGNGKTSVFLSNLLVAPLTPKSIFPRGEYDLLTEVSDVTRQSSLIPQQIPAQVIGIYLDDAAATGNTLENFMIKAVQLSQPRLLALLCVVVLNRLSPREVRFFNVCRNLNAPHSAQRQNSREFAGKGIPFRFRSLFHLQVRAADPRDPQSVPDLIREIQKHEDYFDERLKAYAAALRQRLDSVFVSVQSNSTNRNVIQHPFFAGQAVDAPLGINAVLLRHLLALNEQNEGVVSEVLRVVTEMKRQQDYRLLSMLALEPKLLAEDPIANHCWIDLSDLSVDCLASSASASEKSDALAVLCHRPDEFLRLLTVILPYISGNVDLMNQVAAVLLSFSRHSRNWYEAVQTQLDVVKGSLSEAELDWLRTIVEVPERAQTSYIVRDEAEAIAKIHTLVGATWTHEGLEHWQAFDSRVKRIVEGDDQFVDRDAELGTKCLNYAELILLSALAGMRHLGSKRLSPQDCNRIWEALIEGIRRVSELRRLLSGPRDVGTKWREAVGDAWNILRRRTIKAASPIRFLGSVETISPDPSVIEELLPRLYSAPYALVRELATEYVPDLMIVGDEHIFLDDCVLVPVERSLVHDFMRIILDTNMGKYGKEGTRRVMFSLVAEQGRTRLELEFRNVVRRNVPGGERTGLTLLREIARQGRFYFYPEPSSDEYHTKVVFPEALRISPEILRE